MALVPSDERDDLNHGNPHWDDPRDHRNDARARSFGTRAEEYDRMRPAYPDALIADLLALRPSDALDVGCGTGKAAVPLVARGVRVLGVEVDERMAEIARRREIAVEVASFEGWEPAGRRFDLVISGQAWHWVDPVRGAHKAAQVLRPGGSVALFWNLGSHPPEVQCRLDAIYADIAPDMPTSVLRGGYRSMQPYLVPLAAAGLNRHTVRHYPWQQRYSRDEWLRLLATHSDHATLPAPQFEQLAASISALIDELGGNLSLDYETALLLAWRS